MLSATAEGTPTMSNVQVGLVLYDESKDLVNQKW
jgi:hypothetical protein